MPRQDWLKSLAGEVAVGQLPARLLPEVLSLDAFCNVPTLPETRREQGQRTLSADGAAA